MSIKHISEHAEYNEFISSSTCVVKFTADWCGPCKRMNPVYQALAEATPMVTFIEVNIEEANEITDKENVQSIPLFLFYINGTKRNLLTVQGVNPKLLGDNLIALVNEMKLQSDIVLSSNDDEWSSDSSSVDPLSGSDSSLSESSSSESSSSEEDSMNEYGEDCEITEEQTL